MRLTHTRCAMLHVPSKNLTERSDVYYNRSIFLHSRQENYRHSYLDSPSVHRFHEPLVHHANLPNNDV